MPPPKAKMPPITDDARAPQVIEMKKRRKLTLSSEYEQLRLLRTSFFSFHPRWYWRGSRGSRPTFESSHWRFCSCLTPLLSCRAKSRRFYYSFLFSGWGSWIRLGWTSLKPCGFRITIPGLIIPLRGELDGFVSGFRILGGFSFVVSDHDLLVVV